MCRMVTEVNTIITLRYRLCNYEQVEEYYGHHIYRFLSNDTSINVEMLYTNFTLKYTRVYMKRRFLHKKCLYNDKTHIKYKKHVNRSNRGNDSFL